MWSAAAGVTIFSTDANWAYDVNQLLSPKSISLSEFGTYFVGGLRRAITTIAAAPSGPGATAKLKRCVAEL